MNKAKLLNKHKQLFGGEYVKKDGRVYWKKTETSEPVLVTSGWVLKKVLEGVKPEVEVTTTLAPVIENKEDFSPLPQIKKSAPKKKKVEETPKTDESI